MQGLFIFLFHVARNHEVSIGLGSICFLKERQMAPNKTLNWSLF